MQRRLGILGVRFAFSFMKFVDHLICAEKSYPEEIKFDKDRISTLENKLLPNAPSPDPTPWSNGENLKMVFTGTLSEYSGVFNAIDIFSRIHLVYPQSSLTIVGSYHDQAIASRLISVNKQVSNIQLQISHEPIDHDDILKAIHKSNLGIIGYQPDKVNYNRIPTKLFEYAGMGLPYLIYDHPYWTERCLELGGAIPINFTDFTPKDIINELSKTGSWDPKPSLWIIEEDSLKSVINNLIE